MINLNKLRIQRFQQTNLILIITIKQLKSLIYKMNKFPSHKHSFQRNIVKNNIVKQILIPQNSSEKDRKQKTNLR